MADVHSMPMPASRQEAGLPVVTPGFGNLASFELIQRAAKVLSSSDLVPAVYRQQVTDKQGNVADNPRAIANCVVAMNMAVRMNADPLMVMQNLNVIEGRPSWSSQWIIAQINQCGRFSPLRFDMKVNGKRTVKWTTSEWTGPRGNRTKTERQHEAEIDDVVCVAWAIEKATNQRIDGPPVSMEMACKEGWYGKPGSKWQTMPDMMLRYRSAAFFGRLYAPELLMGLPASDELHDTIEVTRGADGTFAASDEQLAPRTVPMPTSVKTETTVTVEPDATVDASAPDTAATGGSDGEGEATPTATPEAADKPQPQVEPATNEPAQPEKTVQPAAVTPKTDVLDGPLRETQRNILLKNAAAKGMKTAEEFEKRLGRPLSAVKFGEFNEVATWLAELT